MMSRKPTVILLCSCLAVFVGSENVTTVFQLEPAPGNSGYENYGSWKVVSRNDARGIPVRKGSIGLSNVWAGQPCCESWSRDGWSKLSKERALQENPLLDLDPIESADSMSLAKTSEEARQYKQDPAGVWRGTMVLNSRVRLQFRPPESGRAALGIFLCGAEGEGDIQCIAVVMTGSSANGKTVRYQTTRYGSRETGSRRPTPNGNLKTYVVRRDDRVREGWLGDNTFNFRIERSIQGDLEVQLDNGDVSQRRQMVIPGKLAYSKLAVSLLAAASDTAKELTVTEDTAWNGEFAPGAKIKINFSPSSNDTGHMGFALCEDRFREKCNAQVIDGISGGSLIRSEPPYWTAGSQEADSPLPDSAKNAKWGKPVFTFTLSRAHDGAITITVDGDNMKYAWSPPANFQYLIIDTYQNDGKVSVNTASESITASVWKLDREVAELRSPPISDVYVAGDICVSIVARVGTGGRLSVSVQRYQAMESRELEVFAGTSSPKWIKKRILIRPSRIVQNYKVQIVLTGRQPKNTNSPVLVQWAAGCNPNNREDEVTIKGSVPVSTLQNQLGFKSSEREDDPADFFGLNLDPKRHTVCQNEGLINKDSQCLCRPGFTGRLCEKGCGPNRFGEDCESRCSEDFSSRECQGMLLCTPHLPCDCAPGLMGARCDQPCPAGKYGVGCRQTCGKCLFGQPCDRTTGRCITGCKGALLPPFCQEECGRKAQAVGFIGNAELADQLRYPWHVGIFDKNFNPDGSSPNDTSIEHICGGTLISPNIVVSAAHCFYDERVGKLLPAARFSVAFGKHKRGWDATEEHPERTQKRNIDAIHIPAEFHGVINSKEDDIAVLVLDTPIDESPYVISACFDKVGGYENDLGKGSVGYVVGWGRTQNNVPSEELRQANLPYISRMECLDIVPQSFRPYILAKDRFCAGEQGGAFVNRGDSGGGLVFLQSDAWFLRGVVSVAPPEDKSFSAYTNVSYHRDWIVDLEQVAALRRASIEAFYTG